MASLPTHLSSTCDSVNNNSLLNYHVEGPFVRVGNTNRNKRVLLSWLVPPTGIKGSPFCPGWCYQLVQKAPVPPLALLAFVPWTKATFCPGPKCNRDK